MTLKLTANSFLSGVRQSGLVDDPQYDAILSEFRAAGGDSSNPTALAQAFIAKKLLTSWQAEQLLQGRCKGFVMGRYRLMSLLGTGENSAVFLARHVGLDRLCAIKILPSHRVKDTSYLARFYREAKAVANLNHANIVRAYDVDCQKNDDTELHFLVLEYIDGTNLEKLLAQRQKLTPTEAVDMIRQAAEGLGHAHDAGLVHRDIKPANILVEKNSTVKLLDLGLARFFRDTEEESLTLKHDEKVLGTADYLSPEQAVDSHSVDHRADIYSLGCTFYFALSGHPPFSDGTLVQRMLAHQTRPTPNIEEERDDLPPGLDAIIQKMMAKKPADRYQSAAEVADDLMVWLVDHADDVWRKRNRGLAAVAAKAGAENEPAAISPRAPATRPAPKAAAGTAGNVAPAATAKSATPQSRPASKGAPQRGAEVRPAAARPAAPEPAKPIARRRDNLPEWVWPVLLGTGLMVVVLVTGIWLYSVIRPNSTTTVQSGGDTNSANN
jgi:tRNA A-37 threonylcarbamoyl transferase component Bud32